jgi:hypothetical protein
MTQYFVFPVQINEPHQALNQHSNLPEEIFLELGTS